MRKTTLRPKRSGRTETNWAFEKSNKRCFALISSQEGASFPLLAPFLLFHFPYNLSRCFLYGYYSTLKIINRTSGQALDISGLSTATVGSAIQWSYSAGANQQ
jgi:hypothetical protein